MSFVGSSDANLNRGWIKNRFSRFKLLILLILKLFLVKLNCILFVQLVELPILKFILLVTGVVQGGIKCGDPYFPSIFANLGDEKVLEFVLNKSGLMNG